MITSGASCPGLSDEGFRQADLLADRLHRSPDMTEIHALLSSPVLRAYQTAEVLADTLGISPILQDGDLTEIRPGEAEGLTVEMYRARYGAFDLPAEPARPFAPGGENWQQFTERVQTTLWRLAETYTGETVIAVTHAGFIVVAFLGLFDILPDAAKQGKRRGWLNPANTSLTEWQVEHGRWTLVRYNDTAHLV
jgi:probable phosphoglycerate mutase